MRTRSFSQRKRARLACSMRVDGPIAQLVEQLAFNQWVAGSSPARLTTRINSLGQLTKRIVDCPLYLVCG
jgi:hypothetical protein